MGGLTITYHIPGRRPVSVATIHSRELLFLAGQRAVEEAEEEAAKASDAALSSIYRAEAARIREVLSIIMPELHSCPVVAM